MGSKKTNAARILDSAGVKYEILTHPIDSEDLSADRVAELLGVDVAVLYKTLVLNGDRSGIIVSLVAGDDELDLKKVAKVSGNKRVTMLPLRQLEQVTGYIRGGCSPIGMKHSFPLFVDSSAVERDTILVNAGSRGVQLKLNPTDIIKLLDAEVADLV